MQPSPGALDFLRRFAETDKAELHVHLEGSIAPATLMRLSGRAAPTGAFPSPGAIRLRRSSGTPAGFLSLYRDVCLLLEGPADYADVARDLVRRLRRERIAYCEVYVSPAVIERIGLDFHQVVRATEPVFARAEAAGTRIRVLLDSVRQWGPEAAHRVLDLFEEEPWPRVVGFGLGGDETAVAACEFQSVYRRVEKLRLASVVHAGEWAGPDSVEAALRWLRPVRIAHGFRAAENARLVERLAREGTVLDLCITSNTATGALARGHVHPIRSLLAAGVRCSLSTDDPGLFGTTLRAEYVRLARLGASRSEMRAVAAFSREAALDR